MKEKFKASSIVSKKLILVRILLEMKDKMSNSQILYTIILLFKFLGLIILTNNFIANESEDYTSKFTNVLRNFTSFGLLANNISYESYSTISYAIFIILIAAYIQLIQIYYFVKNKKEYLYTDKFEIRLKFLTGMFIFLLIFHQHMLELLSFIYVLQINKIKETNFYLFDIYLKNKDKYNTNIPLIILNSISIIFINIFQYFACTFLNEPYFNTKFCIKNRYPRIGLILILFISNLQCIHYFEIFIINPNFHYNYKIAIYVFILVFFKLVFFHTYRIFNFKNFLNKLINFLLVYSFFSMIIEFICYNTRTNIPKLNTLIIILISKLLLTISFNIFNNKMKERIFSKKLKSIFFKNYNGKITNYDTEMFYHLTFLLLNQTNLNNFNQIIKIIIEHKKDCGTENCKCSIISKFKNKNLNKEIIFLIETIFTDINLGRQRITSLIFVEFLFFMKNCSLLGYMLINVYINKNLKKLSSIETYQMYLLVSNLVSVYIYDLKKDGEYVKYLKYHSEVKTIKIFNKKISSYIKNFEYLLNFKDKFDSTLKLQSDNRIDSYIFQLYDEIIEKCKQLRSIYNKIKYEINEIFSTNKCTYVELSYKIYSFFKIFNTKLPKKILKNILLDTYYESNKFEAEEYFEKVFKKYYSNDDLPLNIIVEITTVFKIKYFSDRLCQILGFDYNFLIGNDIHVLLPPNLREQHKRVVLEHYLIKNETYISRNTFAFTSNYNIIPVQMNVSSFPNLRKNLHAILSFRINQNKKKSFKFMLDKDLNLTSISHNFEEKYSLDFELINKLKINILKLFDIRDFIQTNFKEKMEILEKLNEAKKLDPIYSLYDYIFTADDTISSKLSNLNYSHLKNSNLFLFNSNKIPIIKSIPSQNNDTENIRNSNISNSKINFSANKTDDNLITDFSRIEILTRKTNNLTLKKTIEGQLDRVCIQNIQSLGGIENYSNHRSKFTIVRDKEVMTEYLTKILNMSMGFDNLYQSKLKNCIKYLKKQKNYKQYLKIKISIRKINDIPFYILSVSQEKADQISKNIILDNNKNLNSTYLDKIKINTSPKSRKTPKFFRSVVKAARIFNIKNKYKEINNSNPTSILVTSFITNHDSFLKNKKREIKDKKNQEKKNKRLIYISFILLIMNIFISIFFFYIKDFSSTTGKNIFSLCVQNYMRDSSLSFLHSSIISFSLYLTNLTSFETEYIKSNGLDFNVFQFKSLISERADLYRNNLFKFKENLMNLNHKIDELEKLIFLNQNYSKILLSWENFNFSSNFFSASEYISSNSKKIISENNFTNLQEDFKTGILFKNYKKFLNRHQSSDDSSLIYFMNENVPNTLSDLNSNIKEIIHSQYLEYNSYWFNFSLILELILILSLVILIVQVNFIIKFYNTAIFTSVISMFLNLKKGKKINFKSHNDTQLLKNHIEIYKQLIFNFDKDLIKLNSQIIFGKLESIGSSNFTSSHSVIKNGLKLKKNKAKKLIIDYKSSLLLSRTDRGLLTSSHIHSPIISQNNLFSESKNANEDAEKGFNSTKVVFKMKNEQPTEEKKLKLTTSNINNVVKTEKEVDSFITNSQILKKIRYYDSKIVTKLKVSIFIFLLIFIIISIFNAVMNIQNDSELKRNIESSYVYINRYPIIINLFNLVRLLLIENDASLISKIEEANFNYDSNYELFRKLLNSKDNNLILTSTYDMVLSNTTLYNATICSNDKFCDLIIHNSLNSKGIHMSVESVIHTINNIYKDYSKMMDNSTLDLKNMNIITKYFSNEEFANVNLQMEYVYEKVASETYKNLNDDMSNLFNNVSNFHFLFGIIQVIFSLFVIIYLITISYSKLHKTLTFVLYSSKKFNKVLFEFK